MPAGLSCSLRNLCFFAEIIMAQFTLFFEHNPLEQGSTIQLSEDTSRHAVQVLRMKEGAIIALTNGCGREAMCRIEAGR